MKKKKWPFILIVLGALVAIGAGVGITMWNKAPAKVEDKKGLEITAANLCNEFSNNEAEANRKFLNQALEVSGTVEEVIANQEGKPVIRLIGNDMMNVQCTMRDDGATAEKGKNVTVKGFCSGNTMFDVLLTDCIVK
jgi:hypothetical protein